MKRKSLSFRNVVGVMFLVLAAVAFQSHAAEAQSQQITTPEEFFGFQMGADRTIARWDRMVEYYNLLQAQSSRIHVVEMGPSTLGNPFLALFISSPENLARMEEFRQINAQLSDPRGIPEDLIKALVADGKVVINQSMSLHATEIGGSLMAVELAYDLASRTDEEAQRILDNVIFVMIPSLNPDGQIMVTDWYRETVGTEFEGASYPSLYHIYTGHDNNRDAFQTNTVESQYQARLMFREWIPQAYIDHHHMGSYTARFYVPPYAEPIRPFSDPLVWREMSWYGAHIAYKEEEAGLSGIVNSAIYGGWGHFGFHWITPFHNIAGMLTEAAGTRLATPIYIHKDQLQGGRRQMPAHEPQTTFPNPWPGGWWRLRDIVERQKVSAWATLDIAARNRETVLWNAYLKAKRQTERGTTGERAAYIIPAEQHDTRTTLEMIDKLLGQGIEVHHSELGFTHEGKVYGPGTHVVSMAQPKMGVIRWLLGRTFYPQNSHTIDALGNPIRPYDMGGDVMAEFMGVFVDEVGTQVAAPLTVVTGPIDPVGTVTAGAFGYRLDGRQNHAFKAVNLLFDEGVDVRRVHTAAVGGLRPGDFLVGEGAGADVEEIARQTGVDFEALGSDVTANSYDVERLRIGMYQRYYGGNMDEGWTRWLLEHYDFPYTTLMDAEITGGDLAGNYDVIILPADRVSAMTGEGGDEDGGGPYASGPESYPPAYRSGFGQAGVDALRAFVESGGTLLTFAEAGEFPIEKFGLPLRNEVENLPSREFWCPGSTLRMKFDNMNPLAYGMPEEGLGTFLARNQAYGIAPSAHSHKIQIIAEFPERDLLQSGWLIGENLIAEKAAMVSAEFGDGRIILIGFRAQHRSQTHGTFKLVFNALVSGPEGN
jgi:hypothetical protein